MLVGWRIVKFVVFNNTHISQKILEPQCVPPIKSYQLSINFASNHQTFQVPKMKVLTYISCISSAYVRGNVTPNIAGYYKVQ